VAERQNPEVDRPLLPELESPPSNLSPMSYVPKPLSTWVGAGGGAGRGGGDLTLADLGKQCTSAVPSYVSSPGTKLCPVLDVDCRSQEDSLKRFPKAEGSLLTLRIQRTGRAGN
jgi:hypothetical protein